MTREANLFEAVLLELERARRKFPRQGVFVTLAALTEEVGELNQAVLQFHFQPAKNIGYPEIYAEGIQVITIAMRVLLDCGLHQQGKGAPP